MKKCILTLALGLFCAVGFAQDYVIVNQGTTEHKYLIKEVTAINHDANTVYIQQGENVYPYALATVDSITFVDAINNTIPQDLIDDLDDYMPIYYGDTPPNIEGIYLNHTQTLIYDSTGGFSPGDTFVDQYYRFTNQDMINNVLDYEAVEYSGYSGELYSHDYSYESYIMGSNNNFTVFFNITGTAYDEYDVNYRDAILISGTKGTNGISNLYYAFVMVEKSDDPYPLVVPEGTIRVFKDGDGWSPVAAWPINNLRSVSKPDANSLLKSILSMPK